MLKQLAPSAVMPPSPKKNAWMASAVETARIDADGPSTIAASAAPTAWPVVPPGSGMLNIITTNENAATSDSRGTSRACERPLQPPERHPPERRRARVERRARAGAEVSVGDVHEE